VYLLTFFPCLSENPNNEDLLLDLTFFPEQLVPLSDCKLYQNYSLSFDNLVYYFRQQIKNHLKNLGVIALIGKKDIKSAFRLLPIYPGDFDLLGFKLGPYFCIDKCLPMGSKKPAYNMWASSW
jgi:hypothetical protein